MIAVRVRVGHLDHMPRCIVTRRIAEFCAHCSSPVGVSDTLHDSEVGRG